MNQYMIELRGLTKQYGPHRAVNDLHLTIHKGEIFGLLGPNGAGKSTTILMMLGLTEPTSGTVRICGIDPTRHPLAVKRKVGYLPDEVGFYDNRTGLENLIYTARLNGLPATTAHDRALALLEQVGLGKEGGQKTGTYSRGMRQRLGLADVLIKNPEIIILDEPTLGIDPKGVKDFLQLIVRLSREQALTVLLSSHHLHQVQQVCDRVGIFVEGRLLAEGDIASLSARLFAGEPFIIEAGIRWPVKDLGASAADQPEVVRLLELLRRIEGVRQVAAGREMLRIGADRDASADIAKIIVEAGFGLTHLQKKDYGLDDIYNRYFEGPDYGKTA